ncbi:MAG: class I SAM-dependent methyltransferase [Planctomycetes bacterium]|nr:class I SAM-dependent methyltransferase [Planctomycetota bacterium]
MGIPDKEWHLLRDACWLQNEWSAGITPKGAFFCEIAGVLDMLFDGPGGWPIEPGWWKREPTDFGDQLRWCELCGFALDTFTRDSSEEIDDVSPTMYEMLKKVESPKLKSGRINVIKIVNGTISDESKKENKRFSPSMPYIERYEDRFNALNSVLFTHEYEFAVIPDGDDFGVKFNKLLAAGKEWIVLHSANVRLTDDFCEQMSKFVLNPGTMHYIDLSKSNDARFVKNADQENTGYAALFCKNAISLREFGFDRIAHTMSFAEIIDMWQRHKVIELSSSIDAANKRPELCPGMKFAIWGTGSAGCVAFDLITGAGGEVVAAVDRDISRHGGDFYGVKIQAPEQLLADGCEFDLLIAANYTRFAEIKREAVAMGIEEAKIEYLTIVCQNAEKIKVAQVACPICGANDIETTKRESVYKCCSCRHVWRHNVTGTDAALEDRYSEAKYWAQDKNHQGITGISYSEEWDNWLNSRLDLLENMGLLMVEDPKKVSVFEFGCSEGMLLHALKRRGFEVLGNDVCGIIEKSQEALGITILPGPIEKLCLSQKFDLIMSFHVMEHLNDPVYVAEKLAAYLKPGGKMLFMVPTGESEIDNLDHIHLFSRESLRVFMGKFTEVINERLQSYTTPNGMTHEVITILGQKAGCAGKGLG